MNQAFLTRRTLLKALVSVPLLGKFAPKAKIRLEEAVKSMELTAVRWENTGGIKVNYKIMMFIVPKEPSRIMVISSTPLEGDSHE